MKPAFRVRFAEEGKNMVARVILPSPGGPLTVKAEVPMVDVQNEVKRFISADTESVGNDLAVYEKIPEISKRAAKRRLVRKLHDNVGFWPGGPKTETINILAKQLIDDSRGNDPLAKKIALRKIFIIVKEARRGDPAAAISLAALRRNNKTNEPTDERGT